MATLRHDLPPRVGSCVLNVRPDSCRTTRFKLDLHDADPPRPRRNPLGDDHESGLRLPRRCQPRHTPIESGRSSSRVTRASRPGLDRLISSGAPTLAVETGLISAALAYLFRVATSSVLCGGDESRRSRRAPRPPRPRRGCGRARADRSGARAAAQRPGARDSSTRGTTSAWNGFVVEFRARHTGSRPVHGGRLKVTCRRCSRVSRRVGVVG